MNTRFDTLRSKVIGVVAILAIGGGLLIPGVAQAQTPSQIRHQHEIALQQERTHQRNLAIRAEKLRAEQRAHENLLREQQQRQREIAFHQEQIHKRNLARVLQQKHEIALQSERNRQRQREIALRDARLHPTNPIQRREQFARAKAIREAQLQREHDRRRDWATHHRNDRDDHRDHHNDHHNW